MAVTIMNETIIERWMKWKLRLVDNDNTYVWLMVGGVVVCAGQIAFAVLLGFLGLPEFAAVFGFIAFLDFFAAFKFWERRQFSLLFRAKEEEIRDLREELRDIQKSHRRLQAQLDWLNIEDDLNAQETRFRD
jgi:hypothetical protein